MTPEQFKQNRLKLGLSQSEMAERLGYAHYQRIHEKETGKNKITKRDMIIIDGLRETIH